MRTLGVVMAVFLVVGGCSDDDDTAPDASGVDAQVLADGTADAAQPDGSLPDGAPVDGQAADAAVDGGPYPIMIAAGNYSDAQYHADLLPHRPYIVYAWCSDPALDNPWDVYGQEITTLENITDAQIEKMVMFSSNATLSEKLGDPTHVQFLKNIGVTTIGYNSEGGLTPPDEMDDLGSTIPSENSVARFAQTATSQGFRVIWGPIRVTADSVSDGAIAVMFNAGLGGIALQEQQFIHSACVDTRAAAVHDTAVRYRTLAGLQTIHVTVQIMPSTCLDGDAWAQSHTAECGPAASGRFGHCAAFVQAILSDTDSIAIWAMGTDRDDLAELIGVLRQ